MTRPPTRIQTRNSETILEAALEVFSAQGFRGATLDQIAEVAGLSKPNLLYYFPSKEAMHRALLTRMLDTWLDPLREMDAGGDPVVEIMGYVRRKI
jgi:TetR/AcrR family transcriptional regulator